MESQGVFIGEASSGMSISKGMFKWWQDWNQPGLSGGHHDRQAPLCTGPHSHHPNQLNFHNVTNLAPWALRTPWHQGPCPSHC